MQILLRVSDVGEQVENWEMFIFSIPMAYRRFSQKIQDKEKRWQSNTHFSGVHQPQSVKAFHVVCFNREQFASFCCLLLSWPWVWWPASERGWMNFSLRVLLSIPAGSILSFFYFLNRWNSPMDRAVMIQAGFLLNRRCFLTSRGGVEGGGALEGFPVSFNSQTWSLTDYIHSFS